jgi:hypothetical protein
MAIPEETLTSTAGSTKRSGTALPVLSLSKYRDQRYGPPGQGRVGMCADFKLRPKKAIVDGVIYQAVQITYSIDGVNIPVPEFTEAWSVKQYGRKPSTQIDQNGTDSILIDDAHVAQGAGKLTMIAVAWFSRLAISIPIIVLARIQIYGAVYLAP